MNSPEENIAPARDESIALHVSSSMQIEGADVTLEDGRKAVAAAKVRQSNGELAQVAERFANGCSDGTCE